MNESKTTTRISTAKERITEGLNDIGAGWASSSAKHRSPNDPQGVTRATYHIHPDVSEPWQDDIERFDTLAEIEAWIAEQRKMQAYEAKYTARLEGRG